MNLHPQERTYKHLFNTSSKTISQQTENFWLPTTINLITFKNVFKVLIVAIKHVMCCRALYWWFKSKYSLIKEVLGIHIICCNVQLQKQYLIKSNIYIYHKKCNQSCYFILSDLWVYILKWHSNDILSNFPCMTSNIYKKFRCDIYKDVFPHVIWRGLINRHS